MPSFRSESYLVSPGWVYGSIPIIFVFMFVFRFVMACMFNPLFFHFGRCEYAEGLAGWHGARPREGRSGRGAACLLGAIGTGT